MYDTSLGKNKDIGVDLLYTGDKTKKDLKFFKDLLCFVTITFRRCIDLNANPTNAKRDAS